MSSLSIQQTRLRFRRLDRGLVTILAVFVLLLPIWTPRLYATDSVQYYVYLRSLLFDGDLDFSNEYARFHELNPESGIDRALLPRRDPDSGVWRNVDPTTGLPVNVAPVGSALLWAPAFGLAHGGVLLARALGSPVPADGYSAPYIWAVCAASLLYGLLGLLLCYAIARRYVGVWPATLATIVAWLASPVVFYMSISPPWSHTGGLFAVALFVWYWLRTRPDRTRRQWLALGLLGGLMVLVREQLGLFLLLPALEAVARYWHLVRQRRWIETRRLLVTHLAFVLVLVIALTPQLLTYYNLSGRWLPSAVVVDKLLLAFRGGAGDSAPVEDEQAAPVDRSGNGLLGSAHFWDTLVDVGPSPATGRSFAHGALVWTPAWALGLPGLLLLFRRDRGVATILLLAFVAQTWVNGAFGTTWHLSGAFGFRRLIEATPLFILGLALVIERVRLPRPTWPIIGAALIIWNVGLIGQWTVLGGEYRRGLVWDGMLQRQFVEVPRVVASRFGQLVFDRCELAENDCR